MTTDKQARKERPIARGVLSYFPDAIAEVAHVSFIGNKQHNGDQPMRWDKSKSPDHADCIARHLLERGTTDTDGLRHSAKAAWRALAMLQVELEGSEQHQDDKLEAVTGLQEVIGPAKDARRQGLENWGILEPDPKLLGGSTWQERDWKQLHELGCPGHVALQLVEGTTYSHENSAYVYIAGPMRGYLNFNFPAFDDTRDQFVKRGFNVISPADIDRATGFKEHRVHHEHELDQRVFAFRDFWSLYFLAMQGNPQNGIVLLPGWELSVGAAGEFFLGRWLGLTFYMPDGTERDVRRILSDFANVQR